MMNGRRLKKPVIYLLALMFPMAIFIGVLALRGVHPFGNAALFSNDMNEQYVAFFSYYRRALLNTPSEIFYSFSNGLGGNMTGIWAYYLLSPFNLVLLLFPSDASATAVLVLTTLKIGFASLFMTIFLSKKNVRVKHSLIILLSGSYTLMSYVINYNSNIMWMDAIILLPLLALGVERIVDSNKGVFYSVILALVIITNYYTAYMTIIFICIYFIWYLSLHKNVTFKLFMNKFWLFARTSIIAGLISAIVEMPNLYALSQSKLQNQTSWNWNFLYNPLLLLVKTVGYYYDDTLPIVFVGSFALILFVLYFFNPSISRTERAKTGLVTVILWISAAYDPMVIMWHAFQQPIGYRYRFMFIMGFWIIIVAFRSLEKLRRFSLKFLVGIIEFFFVITLYAVTVRSQLTLLSNVALIGSLITEIAIAVCLYCLHKHRGIMVVALLLMVTFQLGANEYFSYNGIQLADNTKFNDYYRDLSTAMKVIPESARQNSRIEKTFLRDSDKLNDSLQLGYNGGSVYSSTLQQSVANFYSMIGQPSHPNNMNYFLSYTNGTVPMDKFLGFTYLLGKTGTDEKSSVTNNIVSRYDLGEYTKLAQTKNIGVFKTSALPLIFMTKGSLKNVQLEHGAPIQNQQKIVNSILNNNTDYFKKVKMKIIGSQNIEPRSLQDNKLIRKSVNRNAWVDFSVNSDSKKLLYAELKDQLLSKSSIETSAGELSSFRTLTNDPVVFSIPNDTSIRMEINQDNLSVSDLQLFEFDNHRFEADLRSITAKNADNKIEMSNNRVTGNLEAKHNNESIMLTIPYDKGWQIRIDGEKVKYQKAFGVFMTLKVRKGLHHLQMTYLPPFFKVGLVMFFSGILLLVLELFHERKQYKFWRGI